MIYEIVCKFSEKILSVNYFPFFYMQNDFKKNTKFTYKLMYKLMIIRGYYKL
jgi:hypothetical protein